MLERERLTIRNLMKSKAFQGRKGEKNSDELYPIEVVERDQVNSQVKIHYIGYSAGEDESC